MELETINKLYLELSQVATAKTANELALERRANAGGKLIEDIFNYGHGIDSTNGFNLPPELFKRASDYLNGHYGP